MGTAIAHFAPLFAGLGVMGTLMVHFGARHGLLEWRRTGRPCPSCGRRIERRVCRTCAGERT
jgi:hypothetical protein